MIRKDYLMRYIEQLGEVLATLLNMKNRGSYREALSLLDHTFEDLLEINHQELKALSGPLLMEKYPDYDLDQLSVAAELFFERGEILDHLGEKEASRASYNIALELFEHVHANDLTYSIARVSQMQLIKNILNMEV